MKRWWCSWIHTAGGDYRPVTWPLPESILGYWCTGYTGNQEPTLVAWISAQDEDEVRKIIKQFWPEWDEVWRNEPREKPGAPGDRFPQPEWAKGRWP